MPTGTRGSINYPASRGASACGARAQKATPRLSTTTLEYHRAEVPIHRDEGG